MDQVSVAMNTIEVAGSGTLNGFCHLFKGFIQDDVQDQIKSGIENGINVKVIIVITHLTVKGQ